jgi:adenylate kinase family enzyme
VNESLRLLLFGNSAAGKTTLAQTLAGRYGLAHLDLDTIAWDNAATGPTRRALEACAAELDAFSRHNDHWVVEGCYADLLALLAGHATACVFLNPGIDACLAHARARPWEPHKYATAAEQDANLEMLCNWIRDYETRDDDFSAKAHRRLFEAFGGPRLERCDARAGLEPVLAWLDTVFARADLGERGP